MQSTVEKSLMTAVFEAWKCILHASCLGVPRVVCREQRGALSPTWVHTLARTFSQSVHTRAGAGEGR